MAALPNPFRRGSQGWAGYAHQQNYVAGGGNGSIMEGMFVRLCLANQKPSEREFFVPATRTDLGVLKQEYDYKGSGGNEKLPPRRFSTVGIVREFR